MNRLTSMAMDHTSALDMALPCIKMKKNDFDIDSKRPINKLAEIEDAIAAFIRRGGYITLDEDLRIRKRILNGNYLAIWVRYVKTKLKYLKKNDKKKKHKSERPIQNTGIRPNIYNNVKSPNANPTPSREQKNDFTPYKIDRNITSKPIQGRESTKSEKKKEQPKSGKGFSDIHLNWDAVKSFISDVAAKDKITAEQRIAAEKKKTKPVVTEKKTTKPLIAEAESPKRVNDSVPLEKIFVDRNKHSNTEYTDSSTKEEETEILMNEKETLIDIVADLHSCEKARKTKYIAALARIHCLFDDKYETFWFTSRAYSPRELSDLSIYGRFVPKYSDVAIRMQKNEVGTSFTYLTTNYIKRQKEHHVLLENQSDLQNHTIAIAGHQLKYQYRDLQEFLGALRLNREDIRDIDNSIIALEAQKKEKKTPQERAQITNSIKKLQEQYRILTQQQEDLKNITIYIRNQGEMRYSLIVDPIQTRIMSQNLFDGKTLIIQGGPGTGKTTTMIHRLAYLTDRFAIEEDDKKNQNKYKLTSLQRKHLLEAIKDNRDWMFFSPSQMLKDYLADAMKKEGLENTSDKVWNWKDYCRMILQENYHLLEVNGNNAPFKLCFSKEPLFYQGADIINEFEKYYLNQFRVIKYQLPPLKTEGGVYAWTAIAQNIRKRFDDADNFDLAHFVSIFNTLESVYASDCKKLLRERNGALRELADNICAILDQNKETKTDIEEIFELSNDILPEGTPEDEEVDEEIENAGGISGKIQKLLKPNSKNKPEEKEQSELSIRIQKWLKSYCYCKVSDANDLSDEEKLIADVIQPLIENKFDREIKKIGELMIFDHYAKYTRGISSVMLNVIPALYKKFRIHLNKAKYVGCDQKLLRDIMQRKQGRELHHQEQSLLLGFINTLVKQIKSTTNSKIKHHYLDAYEEVSRPIIGIDEATDFSACDIYAMQSLLTREYNSLTLCGDMMQRMTDYGIKSWSELNKVVVNPTPVEMKTSYRQSKKLLEVAKNLYIDTRHETPSYIAFMKSNKVPAPLVYIDKNELYKIQWISKRISEVSRAYGELLPSIAIFVTDKGYIPRFIGLLQETDFFKEKGIKVLDGTKPTSVAEKHICVYPIEVVKGMEFDVVFFHNIDKTDAEMDLVKRYIYVGVSRAAFFLGITMDKENTEISKYFVKNKDWFNI